MKPLPYRVRHHLSAAVAFALFTPTAFAEPAETPGIAYSAASRTAYYSVNDPRTVLLSVRYEL